MTWAIEHRHRRSWRRTDQAVTASGTRAWVRPLGAGGVGFWTLLLAAWGGISVFVGPLFDYRPTTSSSWDWVMPNWLLHLIPGAVGVFAGLIMLGAIGARGGGRRGALGLASILTMAAGAWFVIGPVAYRWFHSAAAFAQTGSARDDFVNQIGANLGPGVLLLILGGMAFKAGIANPRVVLEEPGAATATGTPVAGGMAAAAGAPPAGGMDDTAAADRTAADTTAADRPGPDRTVDLTEDRGPGEGRPVEGRDAGPTQPML